MSDLHRAESPLTKRRNSAMVILRPRVWCGGLSTTHPTVAR